MQRWRYVFFAVIFGRVGRASTVWALTGTGLPWDQPFTTFTEGLLGSPAHAGVALAILLTGLMWAHTHHQPGIVKGTATVAGGAVAIKALDLMNLFGWGGALF
jgi:type IV secretory pathway VirB2 component (pilin)